MIERNVTREELSLIVREVLGDFVSHCPMPPEEMTDATTLTDDLGMDSLEDIEVRIRLEDIFAIEISDDAAENIKTVGQLIDFIDAWDRDHREHGGA